MAKAKKKKISKRKGKTRTAGQAISVAEYNALHESYYQHQNIARAARAAGIHHTTAKRYIDGPGMPDKGMGPIKERFLSAQAEAQDRADLTLVQLHEEALRVVRGGVETLKGDAYLLLEDVKRRVAEYNKSGKKNDPELVQTTKDLALALKEFVHLGERIHGEADYTIEHGLKRDDPLLEMTNEETSEFAATGRLPARLRVAIQKRKGKD